MKQEEAREILDAENMQHPNAWEARCTILDRTLDNLVNELIDQKVKNKVLFDQLDSAQRMRNIFGGILAVIYAGTCVYLLIFPFA